MSTQNTSYGALYNISFSVTPDPLAEDVVSIDSNYVQLILNYNIRYNISTVATLCRQSSDPTTTELFYGEFVACCLFKASCRSTQTLR